MTHTQLRVLGVRRETWSQACGRRRDGHLFPGEGWRRRCGAGECLGSPASEVSADEDDSWKGTRDRGHGLKRQWGDGKAPGILQGCLGRGSRG